MHFAGVLSEDAPDPRIEWAEQLKLLPIPAMGLVPQPSIQDTGSVGLQYSHSSAGFSEMTAAVSYTLWRHPEDRADPKNLADLDEETRQSLDRVPPWPRPAWLIEQVERMRYPQLWDAVRTVWHREPSAAPPLRRTLIDHVEHILVNRFRRELGLHGAPSEWPMGLVSESTVNHQVTVLVDGLETPAVEVGNNPFVYGVAANLVSGGIVTAVIPRDELEHIRIEFVARP